MKILVVDDNKSSQALVRAELESGGYEVMVANDGWEALRSISEIPPDLITLEGQLPQLNGFETCKKILDGHFGNDESGKSMASIPVVFVTENHTAEDLIEGFQCGAVDFVGKPFERGALLKVIDGILKPEKIFEGTSCLLVDDSPLIRRIVLQMLGELGVNVICSENGRNALRMLNELRDDIQLVITDLEMPHMNGDELCRAIRMDQELSDLPVIAMSATDDQQLVMNVFNAGANAFIKKPFTKELFMGRSKALLSGYFKTMALKAEIVQLRQTLDTAENTV